ncbi:hypothetical protein EV175_002700 [Coemansia sp. RSA 1933]|nr:hypothetical protein EV175_002700 [Coemansia sp. RSA 1933]
MTSNTRAFPEDSVGRWISVDGHQGIVRYAGSVDGTVGQWLGIEWADPQRGKHRGRTKDGKQYFTCHLSSETKGSFIRCVDRIDWGQTVLDAARARYIEATNEVLPSTIDGRRRGRIEAVGFDKVAKEQGDLRTLDVLGLDSYRVYGIGTAADQRTLSRELLGNAHTLLLANNYLTRWTEVTDILQTLGSIRTLDISANHFATPLETDNDCPVVLDVLRVDSSPMLSWTDVSAAARQLHVRSLSFGWSSLTDLTHSGIGDLEYLVELHLECNSVADISALALLPRLRVLDLKGNRALFDLPEMQTGWFPMLESLNLAHTGISAWQQIDRLAQIPRLTTLNLAQTPLFQSNNPSSSIDCARAQVIGRLSTITKLDGAYVAPEERTELERFYLTLCARQSPKDTDDPRVLLDSLALLFPRIRELAAKHGSPRIPRTQESRLKSRLAATTIEIAQGPDIRSATVLRTETKPLIRTMLVRQLRPIAMRLAQTRAFKMYLCADGSRDEWVCLDADTRELAFYGLEDQVSIIRILT